MYFPCNAIRDQELDIDNAQEYQPTELKNLYLCIFYLFVYAVAYSGGREISPKELEKNG